MTVHLLAAMDETLLHGRNALLLFHLLLDLRDLYVKLFSCRPCSVGPVGERGYTLYSDSISSSISLPVKVRTLSVSSMVSFMHHSFDTSPNKRTGKLSHLINILAVVA